MGKKIRVKFLESSGDFSLPRNIQTGSGANPASHSMGTRSSFSDEKVVAALRNLTTHLHLKLPLRIIGLKLFLPVCAIIMSSRKVYLYLYCLCSCKIKIHNIVFRAMA